MRSVSKPNLIKVRKNKSQVANSKRQNVQKRGKQSKKRRGLPSNVEVISTVNVFSRPTPNGTLKKIDEHEFLSTEKETHLHTPMAPTKREGFGDTGGSGEQFNFPIQSSSGDQHRVTLTQKGNNKWGDRCQTR